jgi:non-ribosomal peptide synthetase component F
MADEIVAHNKQLAPDSRPACQSLRALVVGGEALPTAAASSIAAALPQAVLCNTYGPTETSVGR